MSRPTQTAGQDFRYLEDRFRASSQGIREKRAEEFRRSEHQGAIEKRLSRMLAENPLRTDFQERYDEIVADYNKEKDKNTIRRHSRP